MDVEDNSFTNGDVIEKVIYRRVSDDVLHVMIELRCSDGVNSFDGDIIALS